MDRNAEVVIALVTGAKREDFPPPDRLKLPGSDVWYIRDPHQDDTPRPPLSDHQLVGLADCVARLLPTMRDTYAVENGRRALDRLNLAGINEDRGGFILFSGGEEHYAPEWHHLSLLHRQAYRDRFRSLVACLALTTAPRTDCRNCQQHPTRHDSLYCSFDCEVDAANRETAPPSSTQPR